MRSLLVIATALAVASPMARAAVPGHEVTSLPGWEGPLTSKMFSGILPAGESCTDEGCFKMQVRRRPAKRPQRRPVVGVRDAMQRALR